MPPLDPPAPLPPPPLRVRRAALRLGFATLAVLMVAGGAEGAARLWGRAPAQAPSPLPFQDVAKERVTGTPGGRVWPFGRRRVAAHPKPGVRVQLFGESAAEGDGYVPFVAMGGAMERALRRALSSPVDVLDLGTPGAGSRQIVEVVRTSLAAEKPDAVVLYVGNNELHEFRALKTVMPGYSAHEELLRRRLWRSYAYRQLATWLRPAPAPYVVDPRRWPTIDQLGTPADADDRALAMYFYEENLRAMVAAAQATGVPVVVSTVAVNERSVRRQQPTAEQLALFAESDRLAKTDGAAAQAKYREAEALAERPLQALPQTRAIAARVAAETGATLCDVATALGEGQPLGLPGDESFDDACHPSAAGHLAIGTHLAACVLDALGQPAAVAPAPPPRDDRRLDAWTSRREVDVLDDSTADAALRRGNTFVARKQLREAAAAYTLAEGRGADPGVLALNRGLLALYQADLATARSQLAAAAHALPGDVDVAGYAAAVGAE